MPPIEIVKQIGRERVKKKGGFQLYYTKMLPSRRTRIPTESKPEKPKLWVNSLRRGAAV